MEFAGYNINDVNNYFSNVKQTLNVAIVGVSTDGSSLSCTGRCDDTEQVLDIEEAISMAPGMNQVLVYVSDTSDVSIFNRMATDNIAKSLSCSWGWSPADPSSDDPISRSSQRRVRLCLWRQATAARISTGPGMFIRRTMRMSRRWAART